MPKGPLGRELILLDDNKKVLVLLGIDGDVPPRNLRNDLQYSVEVSIKQDAEKGNNNFIEEVNLTIGEHVTEDDRRELGGATLHTQQYEVQTSLDEISQEAVNAIHNSVVGSVDELGFNISGVKTKVV